MARQIFNRAVSLELLAKNPFRNCKTSQTAAAKRYITVAETEKILAVCPDLEWRALFAMARYLGPRIPSEIQSLSWADIDFGRATILLRSPKTANHGRDRRLVPLLPAIRSELAALIDQQQDNGQSQQEPGQDESGLVFERLAKHSNLSTTARKYATRAGIGEIAKFWNAFRASAACDLMDQFGLRRACGWMGHTAEIALKNYSLTKATDFSDAGAVDFSEAESASKAVEIPAEKSNAKNNAAGHVDKGDCIPAKTKNPANCEVSCIQVGSEGLEPPTLSV
ncbi:MAG: site-specific integrase [Pirellulaceae bacterium]|nr:site-specific integrase [Pirellulaceae bacterium]